MEFDDVKTRESIRRTLARYTMSGDRGRMEELVACFAPDGVLEFEHEWKAQGREQIQRQAAEAGQLIAARSPARAILLRHHVSTQEIEQLSSTEARARSYFTAMTLAGPDHVGQYVDSLYRLDGQWLIAHRLVRVDWWSPATIYVDQAERAQQREARRTYERESEGVTSPDVRVEVRGRVGWITLNRPEVMNRIDGNMREVLLCALHRHAADTQVRCVAIAGSQGAFSAGANIDDMQEVQRNADGAEIVRRTATGARIVRSIREMNKPVVAIMDGVAAGAGMNLALACDLRVGSSRAAFVSSFVRIGLVPDWGGLHFLARRVGMGRAADMMMTGRRVDAEWALDLGLLEYLFADETFEEEAGALLDRLAAAPAGALGAIKRGLELGTSGGLDAVFAYEAARQPALFLSDDCREGIAAFREKRKPDFNQGT